VLAGIAGALTELGANIISVVTYAGASSAERLIMVKLSDAPAAAVRSALAGLGVEVVDFRGE
jgi:hypothetical protein